MISGLPTGPLSAAKLQLTLKYLILISNGCFRVSVFPANGRFFKTPTGSSGSSTGSDLQKSNGG